MEQKLMTKSALIVILSDLLAHLNYCEIRPLAGTRFVSLVVPDDFVGSDYFARCVEMPQFYSVSRELKTIEFNFIADIL